MTSDCLPDSKEDHVSYVMIPDGDTEKLSRKLSYHSKLRLQEHQ